MSKTKHLEVICSNCGYDLGYCECHWLSYRLIRWGLALGLVLAMTCDYGLGVL